MVSFPSDYRWCAEFLILSGATVEYGVNEDGRSTIKVGGTVFVFNTKGDYLRTEAV
jgi:hypothetical protein